MVKMLKDGTLQIKGLYHGGMKFFWHFSVGLILCARGCLTHDTQQETVKLRHVCIIENTV